MKKTARKPINRKAETIIRFIDELSTEERAKFDSLMAKDLFYSVFSRQDERTGLSYNTYNENQVLLGGMDGTMRPLKSSIQLICVMKKLLQKLIHEICKPDGLDRARKLIGPKNAKLHQKIIEFANQGDSGSQIARKLNGLKLYRPRQNDEWNKDGGTIRSYCSNWGIKLRGNARK
jgi:hypothetical protein